MKRTKPYTTKNQIFESLTDMDRHHVVERARALFKDEPGRPIMDTTMEAMCWYLENKMGYSPREKV